MFKKLSTLCVVVASAVLAACGGDDNTILSPGSGGGGGGGGGEGTIVVTMGSGVPPAFNAGTIEVASVGGAGAAFTISLPRLTAAALPRQAAA